MMGEGFRFVIEWYDELAGRSRPYVLSFWPGDSKGDAQIAIFDTEKKRVFLKKGPFAGLSMADLHQGALVTIYGRQWRVSDYADAATKQAFTADRGSVAVRVASAGYRWFGAIVTSLERKSFVLTKLRTATDDTGSIVLEMEALGKIQGDVASADLKNQIFAGYDGDGLQFVKVAPSDVARGSKEPGTTTATFDNCSLLVVKPHAVKTGCVGAIMTSLIEANFEISAVELTNLSRLEAENFTEVYKGVINPSDFSKATLELSSGPLVAIEVRAENCVNALREMCGPFDVEVAKELRPKTLRARFGENKIQNAVHCTDLVEDGVLESKFFFQIMTKEKEEQES